MNNQSLRWLVGCLVMLMVKDAYATDWEQSFTDTSFLQFYSNPLYLASNPKSVAVEDTTPTYSVNAQNGAFSLQGLASVNLLHSSNPQLMVNRTDPDLKVTGGWEDATSSLSLALDYNQTTTLPIGISPLVFGQIGYTTADGTRTNKAVTLDWQNALNERWSTDTIVTASAVSFSQPGLAVNPTSTVALFSYNQQTGMFKLTRELTDALSGYTQLLVGQMTFAAQGGQDKWQTLVAGMKWQINDTWSLDGNAGITRTVNNVPLLGGLANGTQTGFDGKADLEWKQDADFFSLQAWQNFQASSYGGVLQTDVVSANWSRALTEKLTGGLDGFANQTKSYFPSTEVMADVWVSRELSSHFNLKLQLQRINFTVAGASTVGNNVAGVYLIYSDQ